MNQKLDEYERENTQDSIQSMIFSNIAAVLIAFNEVEEKAKNDPELQKRGLKPINVCLPFLNSRNVLFNF